MLERQLTRLNAARASIADRMGAPCETAIVLGTGLGQLADAVSDPVFIPYTEIAGFPVSSAPSHKGRLVIGDLFGRRTVMMQGRVHLYEGWSARDIALAIYLLKAFGPKRLVITNAAGGLNPRLRAGDIMLIEGCITPMLGRHGMMVGAPREAVGGTAAGSGVFTASEEIVARALARRLSLTRGVYAAVTGPSYETRAEIRMLRRLGADAVVSDVHVHALDGFPIWQPTACQNAGKFGAPWSVMAMPSTSTSQPGRQTAPWTMRIGRSGSRSASLRSTAAASVGSRRYTKRYIMPSARLVEPARSSASTLSSAWSSCRRTSPSCMMRPARSMLAVPEMKRWERSE